MNYLCYSLCDLKLSVHNLRYIICVLLSISSLALSDSRSPEEKATIVDEFFKRYEIEVAKRPEDHGMDYVHAYIVIAKN